MSGGGRGAEIVAKGEAELVVIGVAVILLTPGVDLVGWLPAELQSYVIFTAGVSASAKEPKAATALVDFLTTPGARAALKAKGVEPVTP
jgi:molybdate transport system substrate-binding protein